MAEGRLYNLGIMPGKSTKVTVLSRAEAGNVMQPYFQTLTGKVIVTQACSEEIALAVKYRCQAATGIPVDELRLICHGTQLEDGNTLSDYQIKNGETIYVLFRMRGC